MSRALTAKNLFDKKFKTFAFTGFWKHIFGEPERNGVWILYGKEKNGKTWFCLKLAEYMSTFEKVLYVSAEEGTGKNFVEGLKRAKLDPKSTVNFIDYEPVEELDIRLKKQKAAKIVFIDNITIYSDEFMYGGLKKFMHNHKDKLIVFIAHEERNKPYTSVAKMIMKLAKAIMRVVGLACFVSGRVPGGNLLIDEEKAILYHGTKIKE